MVPQILAILRSVSLVSMVLAIKALVTPRGVSSHLVWLFEKRLILELLQNLMHQFSEHCINHLGVGRPWLSSVISPRLVIIELVRPKIPPLLRDNLHFTFPLLLVFLNPFVLINLVYELAHTNNRFASQGLPQTVLSKKADLKSTNGHVFKVTIYLIVHFPIPVRVCFQDLPLSHG